MTIDQGRSLAWPPRPTLEAHVRPALQPVDHRDDLADRC